MLIHKPTHSILLKVPDPFELRDLLPQCKILDHIDYNVAVKHTSESAQVLNNLGHKVPPPIDVYYDWPGKFVPFAHQRVMADFMARNFRCFNLSEQGTMKTNAALWASDWLMQQGKIHKVLVLCPLSTVERVWQQDIFDTLMHRSALVVHGTREQRLRNLSRDVDYYIANHDVVTIRPLLCELSGRADIDLIIVDEGSMFRNHGTKKFDALKVLLPQNKRVWWMTGTPTPNAPTDAWAQVKIVNPAHVPKFYGQFKVATMDPPSMQRIGAKWISKPKASEIVFRAMQPAIRFMKRDCIELPPVVFTSREAGLSREQENAYTTMVREMILETQGGDITAVHAADCVTKLRQILLGAVLNKETGKYVVLDHRPRLKVLLECIESASAKVIAIVPFKGILRVLETEISPHYSVGVLNGDISPRQRNDTIVDFKTKTDPHVLLCHPKLMAHGLNLTEADTTIFYGPIYSNDEYQQVIERNNRAGQKNKMTVIRIGAHELDWIIYGTVDFKQRGQHNFLRLYRNIVAKRVLLDGQQ